MEHELVDRLIDLSIEYGETKTHHDFFCGEMARIAEEMGAVREQLLGTSPFAAFFTVPRTDLN